MNSIREASLILAQDMIKKARSAGVPPNGQRFILGSTYRMWRGSAFFDVVLEAFRDNPRWGPDIDIWVRNPKGVWELWTQVAYDPDVTPLEYL